MRHALRFSPIIAATACLLSGPALSSPKKPPSPPFDWVFKLIDGVSAGKWPERPDMNTPTAALWATRGYEALRNFAGIYLDAQKEAASGEPVTEGHRTYVGYSAALEAAYAAFLDPKLGPIDHRIGINGFEVFHLVLHLGTGPGDTLLNIVYVYKDGELIRTQIDDLPHNWSVFTIPSAPGKLIAGAATEGGQELPPPPYFVFDVSKPFAAKIIADLKDLATERAAARATP